MAFKLLAHPGINVNNFNTRHLLTATQTLEVGANIRRQVTGEGCEQNFFTGFIGQALG